MEETRKAQGHQNSSPRWGNGGDDGREPATHGGSGRGGRREAGAWGLRKESRAGRSRSGSTRRGRASAEPVTPGGPGAGSVPGKSGRAGRGRAWPSGMLVACSQATCGRIGR